jgi:hypothetical protein
VITLVTAPPRPGLAARCLLARHRGAQPGSFATLAGQRHDSIGHYLIEDWLRAGE